MPSYINRTLVAKAVGFKTRKTTPKDWEIPRIDDLIRGIFERSPFIGDRHHPAEANIVNGSNCVFFNKIKDEKNNGVIFDVCVYTHGMVPESLVPNLQDDAANIVPVVIKDENGNPGELVSNYRCYALGRALLIELVKGSGGSEALAKFINRMLRKHIDKAYPRLELNDIGSSDIGELIRAHGGVQKVSARLAIGTGVDGSTYGQTLTAIRSKVPNAHSCLISWEADEKPLGTDEAIDILEEAEDQSLTSVTLHFKNGGSISDLSSYRERKTVRIQITPDGRPAVTEIEAELKKYMNQLRDPRQKGPFNSDGSLKNLKIVGDNK